jgi:hypothetical protein
VEVSPVGGRELAGGGEDGEVRIAGTHYGGCSADWITETARLTAAAGWHRFSRYGMDGRNSAGGSLLLALASGRAVQGRRCK